jgi:hypothetical protein
MQALGADNTHHLSEHPTEELGDPVLGHQPAHARGRLLLDLRCLDLILQGPSVSPAS